MHGTGYADCLLPDEEVARILRETLPDGDVVGERVLHKSLTPL